MAGVKDVARYILEQKGSIANPVLQELCRLSSRDGLLNREPIVFEGEFKLIISETYPCGEICLELYNSCPDEVVSAEKLSGGNSLVLTTEEKLLINEALNKYFIQVSEKFSSSSDKENNSDKNSSSVYHADDIYSDFSDENGFTRSFNCLTEEELTEHTRFFPVPDHEQETEQFSPENTESNNQELNDDEKAEEDVPVTDSEVTSSGRVKDKQLYAENTMAMPDVSAFNELTEDDADKTAPVNYKIKETVPVKEQIRQTVNHVAESAEHIKNHHEQVKKNAPRPSGTVNKSEKGVVHKAPLPAAAVKQSQRKKEARNINLFITWLTAVIVILAILLVYSTTSGKSDNSSESEYIATQAETLQKPSPVPVEEDEPETEPETEPVTEPPETSTEPETTEETTTVPEETEAEEEQTTVSEENEYQYSVAGDGRRVLDSYVSADINRDGKNDMIEVYKYSTDDIFYDISYSDGSSITYTFPNGDGNRTLDYIVYDKKTDSVYAAGLNISDTGIRFTQINSVTRFSIEQPEDHGEKAYYINYSACTPEEIHDYYDSIEVMYSFSDKNANEFRKTIKSALK